MCKHTMMLLLVILSTLFAGSWCHLCLVSPRQRGPMDISKGGSSTCFRHGSPCGGQSSELPMVTYKGGQTAFIKWQQNRNHYEVGFPGYMDVAVANISDMTNFVTLAVVGDDNFHAHDHQKNYTVLVVLPNMSCYHCVLRVRYVAHKPDEDIFYQCADIRITQTDQTDQTASLANIPLNMHSETKTRLIMAASLHDQSKQNFQKNDVHKLYGFSNNIYRPSSSQYVSIDINTGSLTKIKAMNFSIDFGFSINAQNMSAGWLKKVDHWKRTEKVYKHGLQTPAFIFDQVAAVMPNDNISAFIKHTQGNSLDNPTGRFLAINILTGDTVEDNEILFYDGKQINSLNSAAPLNWYVLQIEEEQTRPGYFTISVGFLMTHSRFTLVGKSAPEHFYVNFQWAEHDPDRHFYYFLMGNENTPDTMSARIYTCNIMNGNFSYVDIDVSKYTFQSLQLYLKTGKLYAMSPGLFKTSYPAWSLVVVDPTTGNVTKLYDITPPGIFDNYYGGTVVNGIDQDTGILYYVLRVADSEANVIVQVNIDTGHVQFSQLTNLRHLHNVVYFNPKPFFK